MPKLTPTLLPRREFLKKAVTAGLAFTIVPSHVISGLGYTAPSDKLNIVGVGVGGKGLQNLTAMNTENIIGLCDIDWNYSQRCFETFPKAKKYYDWRVMFEELGDEMDAVMVATADHTHAAVAATAMTMNKHVYCLETADPTLCTNRRLLTKLAKQYPVANPDGQPGQLRRRRPPALRVGLERRDR